MGNCITNWDGNEKWDGMFNGRKYDYNEDYYFMPHERILGQYEFYFYYKEQHAKHNNYFFIGIKHNYQERFKSTLNALLSDDNKFFIDMLNYHKGFATKITDKNIFNLLKGNSTEVELALNILKIINNLEISTTIDKLIDKHLNSVIELKQIKLEI